MGTKWRIKKVTKGKQNCYILQKRLMGVLWWYNPDNIDANITGVYDNLWDAKEAYAIKVMPVVVSYLEI